MSGPRRNTFHNDSAEVALDQAWRAVLRRTFGKQPERMKITFGTPAALAFVDAIAAERVEKGGAV
jgi:hypothetical protein